MTISQAQYIDLLVKKLVGVSKTDTNPPKAPSNESIASPPLLRGDIVWTQSDQIPATAQVISGITQSYLGGSSVQCTADPTVGLIGGVNPTWLTGLTDWIPPEFGSTWLVKIYAGPANAANIQSTGTQLFAAGSGGTGEYFFDNQAGLLNFIGNTIPASLTAGNVIYAAGYRYVGLKGTTNLPGNTTIGNLIVTGNTISTNTANGNITLAANGTGVVNVTGNITANYYYGNGSQLTGIISGGNTGNITFDNTTISSNVANANIVIQANGVGNINLSSSVSVTGNVTSDYYYGNGYFLTGIIPPTSIINQTINGNNVANTFTLLQSASANTVLVTINGITQTPDIDYNVTGNSITFSTAPYNGDVVQIRFLAVAGNGGGGGGNANTGNVTFDNINIIGTGNLHLQPDPANAGSYLDIFLTSGPDIHIAKTDANVILGSDTSANVTVGTNGNVYIQASTGTARTWTFDSTGNLTLPGNTFAIKYANNTPVPTPAQGTTGAQGATGAGTQGVQGTTGAQGFNGSLGSQGTTGTSGSNGSQGTTGTTGAQGFNGSLGSQGTTGTTGAQGTAGSNGSQGTTGTSGSNGSQGTTGTTGAQGTAGSNGSQGTTGTTGAQGTAGSNGSQGTTGTQGTTGSFSGNLTANINGQGYSISNVATISTTGNITTAGNVLAANVSVTGNVTGTTFLGNLVGTTVSTTGNVSAGNLILGGQTVQLTGAVNPGYMNVGLNNAISGIGAGSVLIYDAVLKNNGTAVTYNTSTGVFTLTAGVTYNLMATGSWSSFSDVTNGYLVYAWVDATTGTRLDTTGDSDGIAEPINRPVNEFNATAAELIYTPVTNQTVKVAVVANGGTATLRGGIGSKAIVTQINPTVSLGAVSTISATGSITAGGGLNITGNIVGTSPNVSLVAGSYTWTFDNTGNVTLPAGGDLVFSANTSLTSISNGNITIDPNGTGQLVVTAITPATFGNTLSVAGTVTSLGTTNGTAFAVVGNGAASNVALGFFPTGNTPAQMAIRDYSTANSYMYFDATAGSANTGGTFAFRSSNAYTVLATINTYGVSQPTKPGFRVYGNGVTGGLNVTTNGNGVLNGNNWAVDYNQGSYLNSTTGVFAAPAAGLYQVNLVARVANNTAGASQAVVIKNASTTPVNQLMWEVAANCTTNHFGVGTVSKLAVGDTLTLKVTQGNVTFDVNDSWSVAFIG